MRPAVNSCNATCKLEDSDTTTDFKNWSNVT